MPDTAKKTRSRGAMIVACLFVAVIVPNAVLVGFALFGPSPWLLDREQLARYADKARLRQGGKVETKLFDDHGSARNAARRYVERTASSGWAKLGDTYTFERETGVYEMVVTIDGVIVRVAGDDEAHAQSIFAGLPFVHENPQRNVVWVVFNEYLAEFLFGLALYVVLLVVIFSRWSAASLTVRPAAGTPVATEHELKKLLLQLSNLQVPVQVMERPGRRLLIEWRVADAEWRAILQRGGLRLRHRMLLDFDDTARTVRAVHTTSRMSWARGWSVVLYWFWSRSVVAYEFEAAAGYGVLHTNHGWQVGEAYRYRYVRSELVQPVIAAIVHRGWTYRPVYTFFRPLGG